jgi:hypothetical protein
LVCSTCDEKLENENHKIFEMKLYCQFCFSEKIKRVSGVSQAPLTTFDKWVVGVPFSNMFSTKEHLKNKAIAHLAHTFALYDFDPDHYSTENLSLLSNEVPSDLIFGNINIAQDAEKSSVKRQRLPSDVAVLGLKCPNIPPLDVSLENRRNLALLLQFRGLKFAPSLVYSSSERCKNSPKLDKESVQSLSSSDMSVVDFCQPYFKRGLYGAIEIKEVPLLGVGVFTTGTELTKKGTLFCQYHGKVVTHGNNLMSSDESIMTLLEPKSGKSEDRLVILADEECNLARFFNGVNTEHEANVSTARISLHGEICVLLFAKRDINPGEELRYVYGSNYTSGQDPHLLL